MEKGQHDFMKYERISDTLLWFNSDVCLKFNVSLAKKDKKGSRKFFYKEWIYDSKYADTGDVISIKREIRCYLTIDNIRQNSNGIMIERGDLPMLRTRVSEAAGWLTSQDVFKYVGKENKLQIMSDIACGMNLGDRSALRFEPVVLTFMDSAQEPGIRMSIGDTQNFIDVKTTTWMEFYELLRTLDMYTAACAVIASIPMSREDAQALRGSIGNIGGERSTGAATQGRSQSFFDK